MTNNMVKERKYTPTVGSIKENSNRVEKMEMESSNGVMVQVSQDSSWITPYRDLVR